MLKSWSPVFVPDKLDAAMVPAKVAEEESKLKRSVPSISNLYLPLEDAILNVCSACAEILVPLVIDNCLKPAEPPVKYVPAALKFTVSPPVKVPPAKGRCPTVE